MKLVGLPCLAVALLAGAAWGADKQSADAEKAKNLWFASSPGHYEQTVIPYMLIGDSAFWNWYNVGRGLETRMC